MNWFESKSKLLRSLAGANIATQRFVRKARSASLTEKGGLGGVARCKGKSAKSRFGVA